MSPGLRLGLSVAAGVVGAVIAGLIWSRPPIFLGLILGAVIGAAAFFGSERYLAGQDAARGEAMRPRREYAAGQAAVATPTTDAAAAPAADPAAEGQARWAKAPAGLEQTVSGRRPVRAGAPGPSPDLARFVRKELLKNPVRLPQCPTCGSFAVGATAGSGVYTFACQACEHSWRWSPGEPWSRVVIDPRVRIPRYRDYPEGEEADNA